MTSESIPEGHKSAPASELMEPWYPCAVMLKHVNKKVRFQSLYLQQMINYMDKSAGAAMLSKPMSAAQFLCKRRFGTDFYALRSSALSNLTLQPIWNHKITKHLYVWTVGGENPRWHRGSMQTPHTKISAAQCTQIQDLLLFLRQQCCQCACQIRLCFKKANVSYKYIMKLG